MALRYERATKNFERAVNRLRKNLQYLANKGAVGDQFISIQNEILRALSAYQETMELIVGGQELEITELMLAKSAEFENLKNQLISMEAICLIHGIKDFPIWLRKGKAYLVAEAIELNKLRTVQIPTSILRVYPNLLM